MHITISLARLCPIRLSAPTPMVCLLRAVEHQSSNTCRFEMAFNPMDRARFTVGKAIDEIHSIIARQTLIPCATIKYGNPIGPGTGQVPALDGRQGVANSSAGKAGTGRRSCGRDGSDRPVQANKDRVPGNTTATISIC